MRHYSLLISRPQFIAARLLECLIAYDMIHTYAPYLFDMV